MWITRMRKKYRWYRSIRQVQARALLIVKLIKDQYDQGNKHT